MKQEFVVREQVATCLECDRKVKIPRTTAVDDIVVCSHCGTSFIVIDLTPLEIDYIDDNDYDTDDWDDDDDDFDDE